MPAKPITIMGVFAVALAFQIRNLLVWVRR
jgi:hypothetical protein